MSRLKMCLLLPLLAGCSHTATFSTVMLPDGSNGGTLTCTYRTQCMHEATRVCNGGYQVLSAEDNNPHVVDQNGENSYLVPANDFNPSNRGTEYVVRCNPHRGDGS